MEKQNQLFASLDDEKETLQLQLSELEAAYATNKQKIVAKIDAIKQLRLAYDVAPVAEKAGEASVPNPATKKITVIVQRTSRGNTFKAQALHHCLVLLGTGEQMTTRELVAALETRGVNFTVEDKTGNLSVILSRDSRFVSDRRLGWSLQKETPATPEGGQAP